MNVSRQKILQVLFGVIVIAWIPLCASSYQDAEGSYSAEGAWLCYSTINGLGRTLYWMDNYTSDSNRPGVSGTVLCTLPIPLPGMTQSGHGTWIRVGKNTFAFTVLRLLTDANGDAIGTAKFWGSVTVDADDHLSGTMKSQNYFLNGTVIPPGDVLTAEFEGTRIEVKVGG